MESPNVSDTVTAPSHRGVRTYAIVLGASLAGIAGMNATSGVGNARSTELAELAATRQSATDLVVSPHLEHRGWVRGALGRACPDTLVTGSSTMGQLSRDFFPRGSFLNAWMGGPTLEDFRTLAGLLRERDCRPHTLVLGVDPWWTGNPVVQDERWYAWAEDYARGADLTGPQRLVLGARVAWGRATESLSFTTTRESALLLATRLRGGRADETRVEPEPLSSTCAGLHGAHDLRAHDGHYLECPGAAPDPTERLRIATTYLERDMHSSRHWEELAERRLDALESLVSTWSRTTGHVVLLAPPFHPETWRVLNASPVVHDLLDRLDARLARMEGPGVRFVNLRDPARVGCTDASFLDSHHPARECMQVIAERVETVLQNWK